MHQAALLALLLAIANTGAVVYAERKLSDGAAIAVAVVGYAAALLVWQWPRFRAAWRAFWAKEPDIDTLDWRVVRKHQFDKAFLGAPVVRGKRFVNERVVVDGQRFIECVFENVTFVFKGDAPFELVNCKTEGTSVMDVGHDPNLRGMFELARVTGYFHDQIVYTDGDQPSKLSGPERTPPPAIEPLRVVAFEYRGATRELMIANDANQPVYDIELDFRFGVFEVEQGNGMPIPRLDPGAKLGLQVNCNQWDKDRRGVTVDAIAPCLLKWEEANGKVGEGMPVPFSVTYRDAAWNRYVAHCQARRHPYIRDGAVEIKTLRHEAFPKV